MIFVKTSVFTRRVTQLLPDDEYRELQASLVENPEKGAIIPEAAVSAKSDGAVQVMASAEDRGSFITGQRKKVKS